MHTFMQTLLDQSPESIVLLDHNHKVLVFNKKIQEVLVDFFGKKLEVGVSYYPDFVVPDNQELYLAAFQDALHGKSTHVVKQTKNDTVNLWFEYHVSPLFDEIQGTPELFYQPKILPKKNNFPFCWKKVSVVTARLSKRLRCPLLFSIKH